MESNVTVQPLLAGIDNPEKQQEVSKLVSSLAYQKREDLDYLRNYLSQKDDDDDEDENKATTSKRNVASISNEGTEKKSSKETPQYISQAKKGRSRRGWNFLRCLLIDLPLLLLFVSLAVVYFMRHMWTEYYHPIMTRARRTDEQLLDEYTYYERACTAQDVTQGFAANRENTTVAESLDTMMTHGAVILPNLLQKSTIQKLRAYLRHKNDVIHEEEKFPMSQGYKRLSYGIEATEDEAIQEALQEITSHHVLPELLEQILGVPDPCLTEITAITSFYGAEEQVIHSDTKSDGYAGNFARTYSHSYSLFIPVQDVTPEMGVTQLCPGTHYCTNDITEMCEEEMIGVNQAFDDEIWHAGDGTLINQQVWHGGGAHIAPHASERILFIVSFIARPQPGIDTRQLARGTYFHMKWLMWGHTWSDIAKDFATSMAWPFNMLRSLAIWKPRTKYWGYDLMLAAALRAANEQNGMSCEELETFVDLKMNGLFHIPQWLQGPVTEDSDCWQTYIQITLDKTFVFLQVINGAMLSLYLVLGVVAALTTSPSSALASLRLRPVVQRLVITHGIVALVAWKALRRMETSEWGSNVLKGKTYMRPFPETEEFTSHYWQFDPTVPDGVTTLPERTDVLFGTRFDAPYLGSYNLWLDYHPGNKVLSKAIVPRAEIYNQHESALALHVLASEVYQEAKKDLKAGRFLHQDHFSGEWIVLSKQDALEMIRLAIAANSHPVRRNLHQKFNNLIADYRFRAHRGSALALESTIYLHKLRQQLFGLTEAANIAHSNRPRLASRLCLLELERKIDLKLRQPGLTKMWLQPPATFYKYSRNGCVIPKEDPWSDIDAEVEEDELVVGKIVMVYQSMEGAWLQGTVEEIYEEDDMYDILYEDGSYEENVTRRRLRRPVKIEEGIRVKGMDENGVYDGSIIYVHPSGYVDILFDDGDVWELTSSEDYVISYPEL